MYNSQFLISDYDEDKAEINSINSSLSKNEEFILNSGFNFDNESPFTSNMYSFITQENTPNKNKISIPIPEFKEDEKNQKEEIKLTQKKRESKVNIEESSNHKKCGRKNKESNEIGDHNKYSNDNIVKKIKTNFFSTILIFINSVIQDKDKKLLNISGEFSKYSKADFNKELLHKSLKEIFSANISGKYRNYGNDYNKKMIEKLLNDEDIEKRNFYENLFNLTFLDCIKHIRGDIYIKELSGLKTLDEIIEDLEEDIDYKNKFKSYILIFETIIEHIKGRNRKKKYC